MKSFIQISKTVLIALVVVLGVSYVQAEWNNPTSAPTNNNAPTPINVSNSQQDKAGKLTASVLGADSLCLTNGTNGTSADGKCVTDWGTGGGDNNSNSGIQGITTVNFDGTSCPNEGDSCTIRSSSNVSSVIKEENIGKYTINFTQPFSNNDYVVSGASSMTYNDDPYSAYSNRGMSLEIRGLSLMYTDKVSIKTVYIHSNPTPGDSNIVTVMIVGE